MWYVLMFSGLAILCVVVVLIRNARTRAGEGTASARSTNHPEHGHSEYTHPDHGDIEHTHAEQDRARRERKRRRAQSKADRRKRH